MSRIFAYDCYSNNSSRVIQFCMLGAGPIISTHTGTYGPVAASIQENLTLDEQDISGNTDAGIDAPEIHNIADEELR